MDFEIRKRGRRLPTDFTDSNLITDYLNGNSSYAIATKYGVSQSTVFRHLAKLRESGCALPKRVPKYDMTKMIALYASGLSAAEVGKHFNISGNTVLYQLRKAGLKSSE